MSRIRLLRALVGACLVIAPAPAMSDSIDTIAAADGKLYRLDGIDAPESDQACLDERGKLYRCGEAASAALARFIAGRPVQCIENGSDGKHTDRKATGRLVGQCFVDGADLNHWLVENGWAINFEPYAKGRFNSDEQTAKTGRLGMWAGCFVSPQDFRLWLKDTAILRGEGCPADARERLFPDEAEQPGGFLVKGHYAVRAFPHKGIYHLQACGSYQRTQAKRWFRTEADAIAAGFRKAYTCGWW